MSCRFIVDSNVGKLAKWLRMMGYDALFFSGGDDAEMIGTALAEGRIVLTRDTRIVKRRVVTSGKLRVILLTSDSPDVQMRRVMDVLGLESPPRPFTICLECNRPLEERMPEQVKDRVPPYVYKTQRQYVECPSCHRIYWRGTHWQAMTKKLGEILTH